MKKENPVTVIAKHYLLPNKEESFKDWIRGIGEACTQYDGYLGTEIIQPTSSHNNEYISIFRFNNYHNLRIWMESTTRKEWLDKSKNFSSQETDIHEYKGLGFWFSDSSKSKKPSLMKMSIVTYIGLLPLVLVVPGLLLKVANFNNLQLNSIATAIIVLLMSYVVMPLLTKLLAKWL